MSELGSAVAETIARDVSSLSDAQLREELASLPQAMASLEAAWLKRVRECERRQLHQTDGHRSAGAWLRAHTLVSGRQGSSSAWLARRLARLPVTLAAFEAAEISSAHVKQIAWLAKDVPADVMADGERAVVDAAREMDASDFRRLIDRLRTQWLPERTAEERDEAFARRRLDIGEQFAGLVPVDGLLDPLTAEKLVTVVNALSSPDPAGVPAEARRSAAQRRHDALDEACSRLLDLGELPTVRREKPHVGVQIDATDLLADRGVGELEWSGTIDLDTARMLLCDAIVHPLVDLGGKWNVAIVEDHDTASKQLWRYLRTRDGGCRFPGCDVPAVWCDAHHVIFRSQGGPTSDGNCVLLCKYHHRLIHGTRRSWTITGDPEGVLTFTSPTGQIHTSQPSGPRRLPEQLRHRCP